MDRSRLRIGWVGSGFIGQVGHLANYMEIREAEIVALAELRPNLGGRVCQRYGIPKYYKNHLALLEDPEIEAVVAIVRRQHTGPVALDILNAGLHLFTEKPMAATLDQAERLVAAAGKNKLCYAVGFMRRHDEGVQIAKRMLDELREGGELGPVLFARFYCFAGGDYCNISGYIPTDEPRPEHMIWPIAPAWLPQKLHVEYEHFANVCVHDVNLMRFLFGQRPKVKHVEYRPGSASVVVLDFGEFPGVFEFSDIEQNRWDEGLEIYFVHGRLKIELPPALLRNHPARVELYKDNGKRPGKIILPTPDWTWAFRREDEAFVQDVIARREPIAGGADGLEDMGFIEDIWRHIV